MAKPFKDYYAILGVDRAADARVIKAAYRRLARETHPDLAAAPGVGEPFVEVHEAYAVLSDPERRARYDCRLHEWEQLAAGRAQARHAPAHRPRGGAGRSAVLSLNILGIGLHIELGVRRRAR